MGVHRCLQDLQSPGLTPRHCTTGKALYSLVRLTPLFSFSLAHVLSVSAWGLLFYKEETIWSRLYVYTAGGGGEGLMWSLG